ncbi:energy-coupling factor transporter transmembrane component T [Vibrio sp. SCSIO 43136]|uniref:energy-coupling factor transporter transmembrane component T family protein n=1 Tax=Vibrio sp. SCSIO 43136 TaxID=2819101 RepID=UPI002075FDD5|nr:energy-coupling factor transporter transmembrane component T [Vibrio sp. SCSIO 43136]USD68178.1 energy-coupling factor transporter transmembrane protein EcfT [Vibrio sp. SCSIO 43136]
MISLTSPIKTRAHQWRAGPKLAALCFATLGLFYIENLAVHLFILVTIGALYLLPGKVFFLSGWKHLKIILPFVFIVLVWHIATEQIVTGTTIILRLVSTVALANLVTMTTRLSDMIDVVHYVTKPLQRLGLNTKALELAIALVIRMTPVLIAKGQNLSWAWRARTTRRSGWKTVTPFTVIALDDADRVAEALRARGGINPQEKN